MDKLNQNKPAQQKGAQINELIRIAIEMLNNGFNITKSCVQKRFPSKLGIKFKFNLNNLKKVYKFD